jgi:hypothetical protein
VGDGAGGHSGALLYYDCRAHVPPLVAAQPPIYLPFSSVPASERRPLEAAGKGLPRKPILATQIPLQLGFVLTSRHYLVSLMHSTCCIAMETLHTHP